MLRDGEPLEVHWTFDLAVQADELWLYIRDTSRLNRALGLGEMHFEERDGRLHGWSKTGGVQHAWVEHPWAWVAARSVVAVREYSAGFARWVRAVYLIEPVANGVTLRVYFGWIPRGGWQRLVLRASLGWVHDNYERVLREIEAFHQDGSAPPPYRPPIATAQHGLPRLGALVKQLVASGQDSELVHRLAGHLIQGDELDLHRIQVLVLARAWEVDGAELLGVFLHATRAGLLTLTWDVICPHCRGVRDQQSTLAGLPNLGQCEVCGIDFRTDTAESIEITFGIHPSIRDVPARFYCAAEPAMKAHVVVQQPLRPRQVLELDVELGDEPHRQRIEGARDYKALEGGTTHLVLENPKDSDAVVIVENVGWSRDALRPGQLFNLQQFRDLFSEEYLGADVQLSVGEQTVLFTDIVGSTRMYVERGDPGAFADIRRHFAELIEIVRSHNGAVVKTIGDAVMASFSDPIDGVECATEIQEAFPEGRADLPLRLRISLNTGPCIAVNLNASIDYFGTAVNLAAKLQGCVGAGEVVLSQATWESAGVRRQLAGVDLEVLSFDVPALSPEPLEVRRWRVS